MYFESNELDATLPLEARETPEYWIRENLKTISVKLSEHGSQYRAYGTYWWELKRLLKRYIGHSRKRWFFGPYDDKDERNKSDHGSDILNLHAAIRYEAIQELDLVWLEREESAWHISEAPHGGVTLYRLSDSDAGYQLDLFESHETKSKRIEQYLNSIVDFLPRTWRALGDKAMRKDNADLAAACYKRMTLLAENNMDRTEGWLLQGMTFDHKGHYNKAIYCYMNLYEKNKQHWVLGNIGASYAMAGEYGKAVECYTQALRHMPGNPEFEAGIHHARQKIDSSEKILIEGMSA